MSENIIAWGASKLLYLHLTNNNDGKIKYCVDSFSKKSEIAGVPIFPTSKLSERTDEKIIIFGVNNHTLNEIIKDLSSQGLIYKKDFLLYSDYFKEHFNNRFEKFFGWAPSASLYDYSRNYTLNSIKPMQTTILGTQLILECLEKTSNLNGAIAEVGAFEGGNAFCALNYLNITAKDTIRDYYIFDSFEGFPELSEHDPVETIKKGDLATITPYEQIFNHFALFDKAHVVKGFVPETFEKITNVKDFSLVFFDCDLHDPAIATCEHLWDRIQPGGYMVFHDYEFEEGGWAGVKKAIDPFFKKKSVELVSFFENTMAVAQKPL